MTFDVIPEDMNGDECITNCIFCGKKGHLYINQETGLFDCKRCNKSGNKFDFLQYVYEELKEKTQCIDENFE